jgi:uncharacterized protein DUF1707/uncharacterized protein DUF4190
MLAGDADRERAVSVLKDAFIEGRLTLEEYEDRAGRAYQARTYADLDVLTIDIPRPAPPRPGVPFALRPPPPFPAAPLVSPYQPPLPGPLTNSKATTAMVCSLVTVLTFGVGSVAAIGLGHAARREIRRTGEAGLARATVALVLGYVGVAVWLLLYVHRLVRPGFV